MKHRFWLGAEKLNKWYSLCALGFLLYLLVCAVVSQKAAGAIAVVFAAIAVYVFFSAWAARKADKESVSYNLLWGSAALSLLLGACAWLSIKLWLGL